ncbi:MAG: hypothetical protein LBU99_02220 [Spirochaetaceae bacterium]|jgi:hypothetical protein|nr:hypothetical protein [Spirochaetaceae bacterium]
MKRITALVGMLLLVLAAVCMVIGCDTPNGNGDTGGGDSGGNTGGNGGGNNGGVVEIVPANVLGKGDWAIVKGYENDTELPLAIEGAKEGDNGILKVIWSSSADFKPCELYAMLPESVDYGAYDGISFKVRLPASANFMLLMRNPGGGTTWKVWEDYVYRGTDTANEFVWVTVNKPFADAVDTGWGPAAEQASVKDWLTADVGTQKQINLNPVLNVGGGSAVNSDQVTYFDDIGFYKGSDPDAPVSTHVVWSFDVVE